MTWDNSLKENNLRKENYYPDKKMMPSQPYFSGVEKNTIFHHFCIIFFFYFIPCWILLFIQSKSTWINNFILVSNIELFIHISVSIISLYRFLNYVEHEFVWRTKDIENFVVLQFCGFVLEYWFICFHLFVFYIEEVSHFGVPIYGFGAFWGYHEHKLHWELWWWWQAYIVLLRITNHLNFNAARHIFESVIRFVEYVLWY